MSALQFFEDDLGRYVLVEEEGDNRGTLVQIAERPRILNGQVLSIYREVDIEEIVKR